MSEKKEGRGRTIVKCGPFTWKGPMYPRHVEPWQVDMLECRELRATVYPPRLPYESRWRLHLDQPWCNRMFDSRDDAIEAAFKVAITATRAWLRKLEKLGMS